MSILQVFKTKYVL